MRKKILKFSWPLLALALCGFVLFIERSGIDLNENNKNQDQVISQNELVFSEEVEPEKTTLIIMDSRVEISEKYFSSMKFVLESLSVGFDSVDLATERIPDLQGYQNVVLSTSDLSVLKSDLTVIMNWVKSGGNLMNAYTLEPGNYLQGIAGNLGVADGGDEYIRISKITVEDGFMIGGGHNFDYGDETGDSLALLVNEDCKVYVSARNSKVPILWETAYGDGKIVVINKEDFSKSNRGFLTAAYSLLQDAFAYPVINASAYYIDDFPAPIPEGNNEYVSKEYGKLISEFYMNDWWPTVISWEENYGIIHSGMIIENYSDRVKGPFARQEDIENYLFYGNMLLNNGGELGLHGYNHMPLCPIGFEYSEEYEAYNLWPGKAEMSESVTELYDFSKTLFPQQEFSTYVPPSDILSTEGRAALVETLPNLKMISSVYLPQEGGCEYIQEFDIGEDGIINTPRIVSGCIIDEHAELAVLSELNFHYVQSHFLHPDDSLDVDRGAELGWGVLSKLFENYLKWIKEAAPGIRNVTASQMGQAVEQYSKLSVKRTYGPRELTLNLGGFSGEAYLMVRMNEGAPVDIKGGSFEPVTGNLYLIKAVEDEVKITW